MTTLKLFIRLVIYSFLLFALVSLHGCREDKRAPYKNPESPMDDAGDWNNNDYDNDTAVHSAIGWNIRSIPFDFIPFNK